MYNNYRRTVGFRGMIPMPRGIFVAALLDEFLVDIDGGWRTAILLQVDCVAPEKGLEQHGEQVKDKDFSRYIIIYISYIIRLVYHGISQVQIK